MTNTLKHLALLARMESSGLKLGLTGKFPEDALDQTCERVESFQLQNRLRTGNDNAQIQKELVRTPEFAALYYACLLYTSFTTTSAAALKQATAPSAGRRCPFPGIPITTKKGAAPAAGIP